MKEEDKQVEVWKIEKERYEKSRYVKNDTQRDISWTSVREINVERAE